MFSIVAFAGLLVSGSVAHASDPAKVTKKVIKHYKKTLGCDPASIKVVQEPGVHSKKDSTDLWQFNVDACGITTIANAGFDPPYWFLILDDQELRRRVPVELGCKPDELQYLAVDPKTRVVRGCGRQVTYVFSGEVVDPDYYYGQWVANTTAALAPPPAPAPAPAAPDTKVEPNTTNEAAPEAQE